MVRIELILLLFVCSFLVSCGDDDDMPMRTVVQSFEVELDSDNAIPAVTNREETGVIQMSLYDDDFLEYTITIDNLSDTDMLTVAHIHTGDLVSTGDVLVGLADAMDISFMGNTVSGSILLTEAQILALNGNDVYVNVHSMESPAGLVRGQVNQIIDNAYNVSLSPANEIPIVMGRIERGTASFRIVGSTMFYSIMVGDLDPMDAIMAGHIHTGSSTMNGDVIINLEVTGNDQLGITKSVELTDMQLEQMNNDEVYVNIHSSQVPSGLLRGQIR